MLSQYTNFTGFNVEIEADACNSLLCGKLMLDHDVS